MGTSQSKSQSGNGGANPSASDVYDRKLAEQVVALDSSLLYLPEDSDEGNESVRNSDDKLPSLDMKEVIQSVDTVPELFEYLGVLRAATATSSDTKKRKNSNNNNNTIGGTFDKRVTKYSEVLSSSFELVLKEKANSDQRKSAAKALSKSQLEVNPPPLPMPTQTCMDVGWELVISLLQDSQSSSRKVYLKALHTLRERICAAEPMSFADGSYLSPSASTAFKNLCDFLVEASQYENGDIDYETVSVLTELAIARGSLSHLLMGVKFLLQASDSDKIDDDSNNNNIETTVLSKLANIKESALYGVRGASGELFCCGQNSYGELGLGDDIERRQMTLVSLAGWDVKQVASGNESLAVVSTSGVLLTCGLNKSGQCGQGHLEERVMTLRPVTALQSHKVKFIAASNGCEHMIAIVDTGQAFSWGYNDRGQLGHGSTTAKIPHPREIEFLRSKVATFAGVSYHHSAVCTNDGELYTFGMNDSGQLGLDNLENQHTPTLVKGLEGHEITAVACGLYHTIACTGAGELYSFGKNDYGQLGIGHGRPVKFPTFVLVPNECAVQVSCGYYHTTIVTTVGHVYTFGRNDYGQLGIGNKVHQNTPQLTSVPSDTKIISSVSGCYHTLLLSDQGKAFAYGRNNKGQLGNRSGNDSLVPIGINIRPKGNSRAVLHVAAGFYTSSLLMESQRDVSQGSAESRVINSSWMTTLCGRVDIDRSGEIEGLSNFGSVSALNVSLTKGVWFYEVELVTSGLIQIGWVDGYFQASSDQGEGVGDHSHSWSYDGNRQRRWNSGSSTYGERWKEGDIIGCLLDCDQRQMRFYRNGIDLGVAFSDLNISKDVAFTGLMPAISLERSEIIRINVGSKPFMFPPTNVVGSRGVMDSIEMLNSPVALSPMDCKSGPGALVGSSATIAKGDIFVVGGNLNGTATNNVWVLRQNCTEWEKWAPLPVCVKNHQVVFVQPDMLLVIGGEANDAASRHLNIWQCSLSRTSGDVLPKWEKIAASTGAGNEAPVGRAFHSATVLATRLDPLIFMYGGKSCSDEALGDCWVFSVADNTWSKLPTRAMLEPGPRIGCSVSSIGQYVYLFGGRDDKGACRSDLWRYNTFDRVWQICYDDCFGSTNQGSGQPKIPKPRTNYSIVSDYGGIWIYGGKDDNDELLADLWRYSIALEKWISVPLSSDSKSISRSHAVLLSESTSLMGLCNASSPVGNRVYLFSGVYRKSGEQVSIENSLYLIEQEGGLQESGARKRSLRGTSDAGVVNKVVQSFLEEDTKSHESSNTLNCTAVSIVAQLDRLSGGSIPLNTPEDMQITRCPYRTLCVYPQKATLAAFLAILDSQIDVFYDVCANDAGQKSLVESARVLYPLIGVLRLLRINFFELCRSSIDLEDAGLKASDPTIIKLRERLFELADYDPQFLKKESSSCIEPFYQSIKRESVVTIHSGFSILFPTLLDQLSLHTSLLSRKSEHSDDANRQYTLSEMLLPLLIPNFTSSTMLFFTMAQVETGYAENLPETMWKFGSCLIKEIWSETEKTFLGGNTDKVLSQLAQIESSSAFQCLTVFHRSTVVLAARATSTSSEGWNIFIKITAELLKHAETILSSSNDDLLKLLVLKNCFVGKLIPLTLLSVSSVLGASAQFAKFMKDVWPGVYVLLVKVNALREKLVPFEENAESHLSNVGKQNDSSNAIVSVSKELGIILGMSQTTNIEASSLYKRLWSFIQTCQECKVYPAFASHQNKAENRRCTYTISLSKTLFGLFGSKELIVTSSLSTLSKLDNYESANLSFELSRMYLSQHIVLGKNGKSDRDENDGLLMPPPAPFEPKIGVLKTLNSCSSGEAQWIQDLENTLSWVGGRYAQSLVAANEQKADASLQRWINSPLFRGGLDDAVISEGDDDASSPEQQRNRDIISQIMNNDASGKILLDRIRLVVDPNSQKIANPKLRASRLRRQDSMEVTLKKSGGYEAVDAAVRAAFVVLIKHSSISYTTETFREDGTPSEAVVDAWRVALQLRRWIVREQQKLASESRSSDSATADDPESVKQRQRLLYEKVCGPIVERASVLLRLAPAPVPSTPSHSAIKILPGISSNGRPGENESNAECVGQQVSQIIGVRSQEAIDEEDEKIQSDIFSFLQSSNGSDENTLEDRMLKVLEEQQLSAADRLKGLSIFQQLIACTKASPDGRHHILSQLAASFLIETTTDDYVRLKKHHLNGLEVVGSKISAKICESFFVLLKQLLQGASANITKLDQDSKILTSAVIQKEVQNALLVLDVCSMPYLQRDWEYVDQVGISEYLTKLLEWDGWNNLLLADNTQSHRVEEPVNNVYDIIPVGYGRSNQKFVCGRDVATESGVIVPKTLSSSDSFANSGGIVASSTPIYTGRWYWEVSLQLPGKYPVFVGLVDSTSDLNSMSNKLGTYFAAEGDTGGYKTWPDSGTIDVVCDASSGILEFYSGKTLVDSCLLPRRVKGSKLCALYPAVGIVDSEVQLQLQNTVPVSIFLAKALPSESSLSTSALVPTPQSTSAVCWDGRSKCRTLTLLPDCLTTLISENCQQDSSFLRTSKSFSNGKLFVELRALSIQGRFPSIKVGVVPEEHENVQEHPLSNNELLIPLNALDVSEGRQTLGIMFNFDEGTITVFQENGVPQIGYYKSSGKVFPALWFSCPGSIFRSNFHPENRLDIDPSVYLEPIIPVSSSSIPESSKGKQLEMEVLSCDGGEFGESYGCTNCLIDDETVYSTDTGSDVNIVLKHLVDTPFDLSHLVFRGPGPGYTAPLQSALVFVTSDPPEISDYDMYDSLNAEQFTTLPCAPDLSNYPRDTTQPVMYVSLEGSSSKVSKCLRAPLSGRYILIKLLRPAAGVNIDVGFLGFFGFHDSSAGPAYSDYEEDNSVCKECFSNDMCGVRYRCTSTENNNGILCSTCYDDNRGDLSSSYTALTLDEDNIDLPPRSSKSRDRYSHLPNAASKPIESPVLQESGFEDVELYACGQNNYGELGLGHCNNTTNLENVPIVSGKKVLQIAGGNEALAILMTDGELRTCGLNKSGQCGSGTFDERVLIADPVKSLIGIQITKIAAANGCEHMLAITNEGLVYSWGFNDKGQLGQGTSISKSHTPKLIESIQEDYHIVTGAVSYHHSAIVSDAGDLLTFGMNDFGQLGLSSSQHQVTPQLVNALDDVEVVDVCCGLYHTVIVAGDGSVYSCGKNDYGQLGLGHTQHVKIPTKQTAGLENEIVKQCNSGYYHTLLLCQSGKAYTFGRNDYGQLGVGNKTHQNIPQAVPLPATSRIIQISTGCYHSLLLTEQGRILAFGRNNKGQLGAGSRSMASAELPMPIPPNRLGDENVVYVAAGFYSTYILTGKVSSSKTQNADAEDLKKADEVDSATLYESLMKEVDRRVSHQLPPVKSWRQSTTFLSSKQKYLLALQAGAWASTRIMLYQSVNQPQSQKPNPVASALVSAMLDNLSNAFPIGKEDSINESESLQSNVLETADYFCLRDSCIGLLKYHGNVALPSADSDEKEKSTSRKVSKRLYCNQILQVLMKCGSMDKNLARMVSQNSNILPHILRGIMANDLPSAAISLRLGMLVFPLHSVSEVNSVLQSIAKTSDPFSTRDILTFLFLMVGKPLTSWPKLCDHDVGMVTAYTNYCEKSRCLKGVQLCGTNCVGQRKEEVMHKYYVSMAKSAEAVSLIRFLATSPSWRIATNAALKRSLSMSDKFLTLCQKIGSHNPEHGLPSSIKDLSKRTDTFEHQLGIRAPEKVDDEKCVPENDEPTSGKVKEFVNQKSVTGSSVESDCQAVVSAINDVSLITAAISVIGGHTEMFREGGNVLLDDTEYIGREKNGVLVCVEQTNQGTIVGYVEVQEDKEKGVTQQKKPSITSEFKKSQVVRPLSELYPVDSVPAIPSMFEEISESVSKVMVLAFIDQDNQPKKMSNFVQHLVSQMQWRSMKALTTITQHSLPKKGAAEVSTLFKSLVQQITNEDIEGTLQRAVSATPKIKSTVVDEFGRLQRRWNAIKQHNIVLSTHKAIDCAIDRAEEDARNSCIRDYARDGHFTHLSNSALLSPRVAVELHSSTGTLPATDEAQAPPDCWGILRRVPGTTDGNVPPSVELHDVIYLRKESICFGRSAESSDIVINDRSVSGRHFSLRRRPGQQCELEDFSKNGTIIDGVRVHGVSTSISTGTTISLFLSRGGLLTYTYNDNANSSPAQINSAVTSGAVRQLTISTNDQSNMDVLEPGSPSEMQNRGALSENALSTPTIGGSGHHGGMGGRARMGLQRLRVTNLGDPDSGPQGLTSPNPAVDSPRRSGLVSPRFSGFHSPRTPVVGSNSQANNSLSPGLFSPATAQQRESRGTRGRFNFDDDTLMASQGMSPQGSSTGRRNTTPLISSENLPGSNAGYVNRRQEAAENLSRILCRSVQSCLEALDQCNDDTGVALNYLLTQPSTSSSSASSAAFNDQIPNTNDRQERGLERRQSLANIVAYENPSYSLLNTSSPRSSPRNSPRPPSPTRRGRRSSNSAIPPCPKDEIKWRNCSDPKLMGTDDKNICEMGRIDLEGEEKSVCQSLIALYGRNILQQILTFFSSNPEFLDYIKSTEWRPVLQHLVAFQPPSTGEEDFSIKPPTALSQIQIQNIHDRIAQQVMKTTAEDTMEKNLQTLGNVATLTKCLESAGSVSSRSLIQELVPVILQRSSKSDEEHASVCKDLAVETLLHTVSCINTTKYTLPAPAGLKERLKGFVKGPLLLSAGLRIIISSNYERLWSLPRADPLLSYRHSWRRRQATNEQNTTHKNGRDPSLVIWRPSLNALFRAGVISPNETKWYSIGDVFVPDTSSKGKMPDVQSVFVQDDESGIVAPPLSFERVDVSGKGLPTSDTQDKSGSSEAQLYEHPYHSVWWPVAPPGYVAMGCVAGDKMKPDVPPPTNCVRCLREDIVRYTEPSQCIWDTVSAFASNDAESKTTGSRNQHNIETEDTCEQGISLWRVSSEIGHTVVPSLTSGGENAVFGQGTSETSVVGCSIKLTPSDRVLCGSVSMDTVLAFSRAVINFDEVLRSEKAFSADLSSALLRPELSSSLFALIINQLMASDQVDTQVVPLIRSLSLLIRKGCPCNDANQLLFCRSKVIQLYNEQTGSLTMGALLQALVELLIAAEKQWQGKKDKQQPKQGVLSKSTEKFDSLPYLCKVSEDSAIRLEKGSMVKRSLCNESERILDVEFASNATNESSSTSLTSIKFQSPIVSVIEETSLNVEAKIVYYEVTISDMDEASGLQGFSLGFSDSAFRLDGQRLGCQQNSYAYVVEDGRVECGDSLVEKWTWPTSDGAAIIGDTFGAGLRLDTNEIFFTRNGCFIGNAFSSIKNCGNLKPTISSGSNLEIHVNIGKLPNPQAPFLNYKFHFGAIDWSDMLRCLDWIRPVSEMYGIMDALCSEDGSSRRLPDDFMLSADTFLSEISQEECVTIESKHPYTEEQQGGTVNIPLAMSMRVSLSPKCETLNAHCLQIIGGSIDVAGGSADSESDIRCFTGACGGQEVNVKGNTFKWKFPLQSNFQCRLDRARQGPYIKLENRDTRVTLNKDKGWQCVLGLARLDGGVHSWDVKIVSVTSSSNIFLGVAKRDVRLDSYLGKDNRGWGWIGNRALWHNGGKQRGTYGEKFATGDVVRITIDLKKGTLSYALNGKDLGIAFGPGGTGPKLVGPFYPAFALYNQKDCVELIGGHRVEDTDVAASDEGAMVYDSSEDMSDTEEDVPASRIALACELSALGFPIDWCVFALKHCEDDTARAADFILSNIGSLEAMVQDENDERNRREKAREDRISRQRALAASGDGGDKKPGATTAASSSIEKWGIKFTAIPEFTIAGRRLLAVKHADKLEELHRIHCQFTLQQDEAIVAFIDEVCGSKQSGSAGSDPLRLSPSDFTLPPEALPKYPCLTNVSPQAIQSRFLVIRNFNIRLQSLLPFVDFTARDEFSVITRGIRALRGLIFRSVKLSWWVNILREQQSPPNARPDIEIDRHMASELMEANVFTKTALTGTVFGQAFEQLQQVPPSTLRGADRAFKCQFVGEFGDDFGGLYRECMAQMSTELQSKVLPLLMPCSNAINGVGSNRDLFVPNVHVRQDPKQIQMLEFLGKLMGMAIRSNNPLDLNLPSLVWKPLVASIVARNDIETVHEGCFHVVDTISNIGIHQVTPEMYDDLIDASFTVLGHDGKEVELVPGGKNVHVGWEDKEEFAKAVETYRLTEFSAVCEDIARGLATIIPRSTTSIFTWKEFEILVCGRPTVDVELLRRRTIYGDGCCAEDKHIEYFWETLEKFSSEKRSLFLRFVWGRSRLPPHASDFTQDFKISGMAKSASNPDGYLPLAHTCFFSIDIPAYTSAEVMHERLLYAITHCQAIDTDNTTVAQRAGHQGTNWNTATAGSATASTTASSSVGSI